MRVLGQNKRTSLSLADGFNKGFYMQQKKSPEEVFYEAAVNGAVNLAQTDEVSDGVYCSVHDDDVDDGLGRPYVWRISPDNGCCAWGRGWEATYGPTHVSGFCLTSTAAMGIDRSSCSRQLPEPLCAAVGVEHWPRPKRDRD